eukprot:UN33810
MVDDDEDRYGRSRRKSITKDKKSQSFMKYRSNINAAQIANSTLKPESATQPDDAPIPNEITVIPPQNNNNLHPSQMGTDSNIHPSQRSSNDRFIHPSQMSGNVSYDAPSTAGPDHNTFMHNHNVGPGLRRQPQVAELQQEPGPHHEGAFGKNEVDAWMKDFKQES